MITIKDVAQLAGVSIATVSRVINGSGAVSDELTLAVHNAMRDLHFQPNAVARSLKTESTMTIGVVVLDLSNNQLAHLCYSISNQLCRQNYLPLVCSSDSNADTEQRYVELLLSHKVDGMIINSCQPWQKRLAKISHSIPIVAVYRRINDPEFVGDFIDSDGTSGVYSLTRHLLDNGHRDIFIINGPLCTSAGADRYRGFCLAMEEAGVHIDERYPYQIETNYTRMDGIKAMERMMSLSKKPTAIVTTNPETQMGLLHYMKEHQIRIPDDFSLVCYASSGDTDLMYIRPTCIIQDHRVIGQRASELVLQRIENMNLPNREVIYPCAIQYGNTVKPI